ncbi:MAG: sugar ABC transporter ATP-binding protein [Cyclobacteriaceae bacterium]
MEAEYSPDLTALKLLNVCKSFGAIKALDGVDLQLERGEVHALIGENGAGKSTLMKVLSGAHKSDRGSMTLFGKDYQPSSPQDGRDAGIAMIYQELNLAPHLTVEENMLLGIELTRWGFLMNQREKVREALAWLGHDDIGPETLVMDLSLGKQQLIEIARALISEAKIVIMDEPTSSLTAADTKALFEVVARLKDRGISVVYISHFLEEVDLICDRYTVLRDGKSVATGKMVETTIDKLIEYMVGRSVEQLYPKRSSEIGKEVLNVANLKGVTSPNDVSFSLHKGEILGLSGLVGSGRSETLKGLFGLEKLVNGRVRINQKKELKASYFSPTKALSEGLDLLSENRKEEGLAVNLSLLTNLTLSALRRYTDRFGLIRLRQEQAEAKNYLDHLGVKYSEIEQPVNSLSGGNQQKLCLARLLHHNSDIFFLDEPTRGIDVGSKAEIYKLIHELADNGKTIVMVSSYLPELLGICDSLAVFHRGYISPVRSIAEWTENEIMLFATSGPTKQTA